MPRPAAVSEAAGSETAAQAAAARAAVAACHPQAGRAAVPRSLGAPGGLVAARRPVAAGRKAHRRAAIAACRAAAKTGRTAGAIRRAMTPGPVTARHLPARRPATGWQQASRPVTPARPATLSRPVAPDLPVMPGRRKSAGPGMLRAWIRGRRSRRCRMRTPPEDDGFAEPPLPEDCLAGTGRFPRRPAGRPLHPRRHRSRPGRSVPATVPAPAARHRDNRGHGRGRAAAARAAGPVAALGHADLRVRQPRHADPDADRSPPPRPGARPGSPLPTLPPQWRIILTDTRDRAITVSRLPRIGGGDVPTQPGLAGLVGRVTVIMPRHRPAAPGAAVSGGILTDLLRAAARAGERATQLAPRPTGVPPAAAPTPPPPPPTSRHHGSASTSPPAT